MTNEFKKQCGEGMYWCNTDKKCKPIQEDMPTNNASGGVIAGLGVGPQGEPGINKKKKRNLIPLMAFMRRKANVAS
jgi:hypothetical protein